MFLFYILYKKSKDKDKNIETLFFIITLEKYNTYYQIFNRLLINCVLVHI